MKKSIKIILIIMAILAILSTIVQADSTLLTLSGTGASIKKGDTVDVTLKVGENDKKIGTISGIISTSENVASVAYKGENNWNITYNETTGKFNAVKAAGALNENVLTITLTLKDTVKEGDNVTVSFSELKTTDISYITTEQVELDKTIIIETAEETTNGNEENTVITNTINNEENTAITNTVKNTTATTKVSENNVDTSKANKVISNTGLETVVFPIICIALVAATIGYIQYKKNENA